MVLGAADEAFEQSLTGGGEAVVQSHSPGGKCAPFEEGEACQRQGAWVRKSNPKKQTFSGAEGGGTTRIRLLQTWGAVRGTPHGTQENPLCILAALTPPNLSNDVRQAPGDSLRGACRSCRPRDEWVKTAAAPRPAASRCASNSAWTPRRPTSTWATPWCWNKMRQLQDLGHQVIFLIGDFTSLIGDPRAQQHTPTAHARADPGQRRNLLHPGCARARPGGKDLKQQRMVRTAGASGMIQLAAKYTVARMMERNDFHERFTAGNSISVHEFLYPLMGLRLRGPEKRPGTGRHRPKIQPADGAPPAAGIRARSRSAF